MTGTVGLHRDAASGRGLQMRKKKGTRGTPHTLDDHCSMLSTRAFPLVRLRPLVRESWAIEGGDRTGVTYFVVLMVHGD